jgi:crotonobetainyl-CoA:carnitine CoA-transferase CaiB-like acyl-CoA transferase
MLAGMDAAYATVAALFERQNSGRGHQIDIALVESMTRFMTPRLVSYLGSGELARRSGGKDSVIAIYQTFHSADEPLTLALGNDNLWQRFWQALGKPERAADPATDSNVKRRARRAQIVDEIQQILLTKPRAHWLKIFSEARVPAGPINRLDETTADDELQQRGLFYTIPGSQTAIPQVGTGIRVDDTGNRPCQAPPQLGEHTAQILRERLGYSAGQISELQHNHIID